MPGGPPCGGIMFGGGMPITPPICSGTAGPARRIHEAEAMEEEGGGGAEGE